MAPGTGLLLKGSVAAWKTKAAGRASRDVGGWLGQAAPWPFSAASWEELGFSTGEAAAPRGTAGAHEACPYACCQAGQAPYLGAHLLEISPLGLLTRWRWDDLAACGATALLG